MTRLQKNAVYNNRYSRNLLKGPQTCIYCCAFAEHKDHIPPLKWIRDYPQADCVIVWSCKECNYLLSGQPLYTIEERCGFLIKEYKRKYSRELKIPRWTDKELLSVAKSLRNYILFGVATQREVKRKLKFLRLSRELRIIAWLSQDE